MLNSFRSGVASDRTLQAGGAFNKNIYCRDGLCDRGVGPSFSSEILRHPTLNRNVGPAYDGDAVVAIAEFEADGVADVNGFLPSSAHDTTASDFESDVATVFETEAATEDVLSTADSATESGVSSSSQSWYLTHGDDDRATGQSNTNIGDDSVGSVTAISDETDSDSVDDQSVLTGSSSDDDTAVDDVVDDDGDDGILRSTFTEDSQFSGSFRALSLSPGSSSHFPFSRQLIDLGSYWHRNHDPRRVQSPS
jgi:hypothetical protein